ncbi:hypothetical protein GCM10008938_18850 [Deinococcus roseus]|uniref:Uncharacterized protein n=1 Tax=Deinococcus roseus TaxID=392414 RepID=A0ABQ2D0X5_9DEIO|nr:hypothetical protein GCM10008938_18850 [Deinococcus roseus]
MAEQGVGVKAEGGAEGREQKAKRRGPRAGSPGQSHKKADGCMDLKPICGNVFIVTWKSEGVFSLFRPLFLLSVNAGLEKNEYRFYTLRNRLHTHPRDEQV